jgi:hypothetical protein
VGASARTLHSSWQSGLYGVVDFVLVFVLAYVLVFVRVVILNEVKDPYNVGVCSVA